MADEEFSKTIPLSETTKFIVDNRGRTAPTADTGIALIATNCISNDDLYPQYLNVRRVSQETYDSWFRSHPEPGDIIITNKGSQNGAICLVPDPVDFVIAQDMVALRANEQVIDPLFLFAALRSPIAQWQIKNLDVSGVIPHFKKTDFDKLHLPYPEMETQRAIGKIYFDFCDKIELNRRMNETLEAMARAIFKSWFVDFDPVRAKVDGRQPEGMDAETAALFPDGFEHVEGNVVPKGWKESSIKDHATSIQYGYTMSASKEPVGPRFLRITDIRGGHVDWNRVPYCDAPAATFEKYRIEDGDVFVARTGASTGENVYIVDPPDAVFASYLVRFKFADRGVARFVGEFMRTPDYFGYVAGCIGGSAQPNASAQALAGAMTIFPSGDLSHRFFETIKPMDDARARLGKGSNSLAQTRDALLPKLLSGEIRVKEAEKMAGTLF